MRYSVVVVSSFLLLIGLISISWAVVEYLFAYEVVETRCQRIKHNVEAGHYVLNGVVGVCWDLIGVPQYPPTDDGPVTWCRGERVVSARSYDDVISFLQKEFPITSPPIYFKCYHAVNDYRRMFSYIPDTESWKIKFDAGIFTIICMTICTTIYYYIDCFARENSQKIKTQ